MKKDLVSPPFPFAGYIKPCSTDSFVNIQILAYYYLLKVNFNALHYGKTPNFLPSNLESFTCQLETRERQARNSFYSSWEILS